MNSLVDNVRIRTDLIKDGLLIPVHIRLKGELDFYESNINEIPENMSYYTTDNGATVLANDDMVIIGQSIDFEFDEPKKCKIHDRELEVGECALCTYENEVWNGD